MTIELKTPTEIIQELSKKVETIRINKRLTQKELASRAGLTYGTYRNFIDSQMLSLLNMVAIMQVLGLYSELDSLIVQSEIKTIEELKKNSAVPKRVKNKKKEK